jgi:lipopolysaccharide/colanic/teichoic acid biosynthesis glycosyltransferase
LAIPLLLVVAPLLLVAMALVAMDGASPIFRHRRVGRGGRTFHCLKIRTMVPDAEDRLGALLRADPNAAAEWAANQKIEDDPRITWIGGFLRKASLDELPQLWNVIVGDMSLIGPRPVVEAELPRYGMNAHTAYESIRPGLTGLWQVSGRNDISYSARVALDALYARNYTLLGDVAILFLTPLSILRMTGR